MAENRWLHDSRTSLAKVLWRATVSPINRRAGTHFCTRFNSRAASVVGAASRRLLDRLLPSAVTEQGKAVHHQGVAEKIHGLPQMPDAVSS